MAVNGTNEHIAVADSFWDIDGFKRTVRRAEDGMQQCNELMKLMQERADIEKDYAKRLRMWSKKWSEIIEKGPEYNTTKQALKGCMEASDRLAEVHVSVKDHILNAVQVRVKDWRNENYKKQIVGGCREAKSFEDDFRKAQKPWVKKMAKVNKAKKEYYTACRQERAAAAQENSLRSSEGTQAEQLRKAQERTEKCRKEMEATKEKYSVALRDLNALNGKYMEDMSMVFERTQVFERRRLEFIKAILVEFHNALNFSENARYKETYRQTREAIEKADVFKDLVWWSQTYGTGMSMTCPTFEECPGDTVPVDRSEKVGSVIMAGSLSNGASLTNTAAYGATLSEPGMARGNDPPQYASVRSSASSSSSSTYRASTSVVPVSDRPEFHQNSTATRPVSAVAAVSSQSSYNARSDSASDDNTFDDQDDFSPEHHQREDFTRYENASEMAAASTFYEEIPTQSSATSGVQVRALYDYNAVEDDELTFHAGDVFLRIKEVDAQGWCTGLKDGHIGLYPESYAQPC